MMWRALLLQLCLHVITEAFSLSPQPPTPGQNSKNGFLVLVCLLWFPVKLRWQEVVRIAGLTELEDVGTDA